MCTGYEYECASQSVVDEGARQVTLLSFGAHQNGPIYHRAQKHDWLWRPIYHRVYRFSEACLWRPIYHLVQKSDAWLWRSVNDMRRHAVPSFIIVTGWRSHEVLGGDRQVTNIFSQEEWTMYVFSVNLSKRKYAQQNGALLLFIVSLSRGSIVLARCRSCCPLPFDCETLVFISIRIRISYTNTHPCTHPWSPTHTPARGWMKERMNGNERKQEIKTKYVRLAASTDHQPTNQPQQPIDPHRQQPASIRSDAQLTKQQRRQI